MVTFFYNEEQDMNSIQLNNTYDLLVGSDGANVVPRRRRWLRRLALLSVTAMASAFGVIGAGPAVVQAAGPFVPIATVPLGLTSTFGALTPDAAFASTAATTFRGDIGSTTYSFAAAGTHIGTSYTPATEAMIADLTAAFANAQSRPAGTPLLGNISGVTVGPGLHTNATAVGSSASSSFTIDGQGHADAVFVFQVGGALALGADFHMELINGAQAKNVFWQVNGAGGIGANSTFVGTLMANGAISSGLNSIVNGRLMTKTGAIAMAGNDLFSAPPSVSIDGGAAAYATVTNPPISGVTSVVDPSTVTVTIDGTPQADQPVPAADGGWILTLDGLLINGDHTIVATVVDGAGNIGTFTQILTVDTTPPAVSIDGGTVAATNDQTPTITGTTDVAAEQIVKLTLTRTTPALTLTRTTIVQDDQTWNITLNGLTGGEWTIIAEVTDPAGNIGTATQVLTIDVNGPDVAITSSALTNDPTPTITGTVETGATIAVSIDGLSVTDITQGTTWSATTTAALQTGDHNVSVIATDASGNTALLAQTLTVDLVLPIVAINPGTTDSTNDRTPTIVGTTDVSPGPGVIVNVSIDGAAPLSAVVQPDGWNVTPFTRLEPGDHTIVATVDDPAGNTGTFTQILTVCNADEICGPSCDDGVHNSDETDVDCGGACDPCGAGSQCALGADCESNLCLAASQLCLAAECGDGVVNGDESCDDGAIGEDGTANVAVGSDGCSAACEVEKGWSCTDIAGSESVCQLTCGDGLGDAATEDCDFVAKGGGACGLGGSSGSDASWILLAGLGLLIAGRRRARPTLRA